jgi:hypothetical protein
VFHLHRQLLLMGLSACHTQARPGRPTTFRHQQHVVEQAHDLRRGLQQADKSSQLKTARHLE